MQTLNNTSGVWALGLVLFVFLVPGSAWAATQRVKILEMRMNEVSLSYDPNSHWAPNDAVCVFNQNRKLFCGVVISADKSKVEVRVDQREEEVPKGAWVYVRPIKRRTASQDTTAIVEQANETKTHDIAIGLSAGFNYFYPMVNLQFALGREFSVGIEPLFASFNQDSSSVQAFGGFLNASYYITHFPFRGFYVQGAGGVYSVSASVGSQSASYAQGAFSALVAWRGRASWELGLDIGVGLGLQYIFPVANSLTPAFAGVLPLAEVTVAMPF